MRIVAGGAGDRLSALNKALGILQGHNLISNQEIVWRRIRKLGQSDVALSANANTVFSVQLSGIDDPLTGIPFPDRQQMLRAGSVAAFAMDPAVLAGPQRIRLAVTL